MPTQFFDSHMHPSWMADLVDKANLRDVRSWNEAARLYESLGDEIKIGYGWSEKKFGLDEEAFIKNFVLDIPQEKVIVAHRICGHKALVSRAAQKKFGIAPEKIFIDDRDLTKIPWETSTDNAAQKLLVVLNSLRENSIYACGDLLCTHQTAQRYRELAQAQTLPIDVQIFGDQKDLEHFSAPFRSIDQQICEFRHVKFFLDGSLGAHTAWLSEDYSDRANEHGLSQWPYEKLLAHAQKALEKNFLLAFHVIGDAALDQALRLSRDLHREMLRVKKWQQTTYDIHAAHRLEHVQVCRDDQIDKISAQKFWTLGLQPIHRVCDENFVQSRLGRHRAQKTSYRLRSFLDADIPVTLGTDAPVAPHDPDANVKAATLDTRPNERIDLATCLALMSKKGRQAAGLDH